MSGDAREHAGAAAVAAAGGLIATAGTAIACVGPLVAILLGVGGMGWLAQYAYLRVPASIATATLLGAGFWLAYRRPKSAACAKVRPSRAKRVARTLLWIAAIAAAGVNLFEYVIFPHLAGA